MENDYCLLQLIVHKLILYVIKQAILSREHTWSSFTPIAAIQWRGSPSVSRAGTDMLSIAATDA